MAFFTAWATWQKLVFILACAIVITVLLGCAKVAHTQYKLRAYNAVAERDKTEGAIHRQMSQRRRQQTANDVPFGIRAIESGIEVDGVWVSRSNTPEPTSSRDTSISSMWLGAPRTDFAIDLESQNDNLSSDQTRFGHADESATDIANHTTASREKIRASRNQHPPSSYAKYTGSSTIFNQNLTPATSKHADASNRASRAINSLDSTGSDSGNRGSIYLNSPSNEIGAASISAPDLRGLPQRQRQQSLDLDLMQIHRMSQAAETGQFAPRARKANLGGSRPSSSSNSAKHSLRLRARSESPVARPTTAGKTSTGQNQYASPIDSLSEAARRSTLPDVTPFAQVCRTGPPSPQLESRRPSPSPTSSGSSSKRSTNEIKAEPAPASSNMAPTANETEIVPERTAQKHPLHPSSEQRESSILRGHGSGFEILRPGTFAAERQRSAPPLSLYNSMPQARPSSTEGPRKLQKKRRSSVESSTSGRSRMSML
ncbi:hypothetical protein CB0940_01374 [Cercospora beticola]|uniref:Uncharacterized protein n=1 Tax=Cercospora beticola TaxID=122368 RepID=A0A2G5I6E6_CERBT|nr:hypothetical protein CB0940_01374 [Cercospora beticola]PIB00388.1 hypothetical protein CB0940_01374 [Cercospora beticola]WPA96812.1 hypothetical protein RHO25_001420 [Cercospora beticola]CAK1354818.1 unnamed protein product [Cercospora beticola]